MNQKNKQLTTVAMLCALAYVVMLVGRIPIPFPGGIDYLKYDPKDVIIVIGGFIYGPMTSFMISVIVSLIEMLTASNTGIIGAVMNILSTVAFACTAAFIYKKKHTASGAIIGLITGCIAATLIMLLWNYLLTPLYMGYPREAVVKALFPVFLPFNLIKGGLNAAITMFLYKPIVTALRKTRMLNEENTQSRRPKINVGIMLIALLVSVTCILFILMFNGII